MEPIMPKRPLRHACYTCQRAHAFCDQERPCGRCVKSGAGDTCFETAMKKRGRKPAFESARQRALQDAAERSLTVTTRPNRMANISSGDVSPEDLNLVLLQELKELKQNQRKLRDELQHLKANEGDGSYSADHTGMLQKAPATHAPPQVNDKAIVIYDLTKFPATVKTANETFCRMLGYDIGEVLAQPWTKFVHPAYHERVKQIFNQQSLSTIIEFDLVYRHRNGGLFSTFDSHTIIFAADGTPVSDLVAIKLNPHPISMPAPQMGQRPTPLLTGEVFSTPSTSSSPSSRYSPLGVVSDDFEPSQGFRHLSIHDPTAPAASRPIPVPGRSPFAPSPSEPLTPMSTSAGLASNNPSAMSLMHDMPSIDPSQQLDPSALLSASPSRFLSLSGDDMQLLMPHGDAPDVLPLPLPVDQHYQHVQQPYQYQAPADPLRSSSALRSSMDDLHLQPVNDEEFMQLLSNDVTGGVSHSHHR